MLSCWLLAQAGITPNIIYEGDDVHTLAGLIASGMGVSILPKITTIVLPDVVFIPFTDVSCKREIGLAWNSAAEMPPASDAFRQYILQRFSSGARSRLQTEKMSKAMKMPARR